MKNIGLIPARFDSSRLPGKALIKIHGLPMVVHVAKRSAMADQLDNVFVCTDSTAIASVCEQYGINVCLTASFHRNGTERISQAANLLGVSDHDIVIDIQGDEPLVDPIAIDKVVSETKLTKKLKADIFLPYLKNCSPNNRNIVKVIESGGDVLYLSRSDIPHEFSETTQLKKHLSVIGFTGQSLRKFSSLNQGPLERIEGVELLRALEGGMKIRTAAFDGDSISIDVESDLERVKRKMMACPIARRMCGYD